MEAASKDKTLKLYEGMWHALIAGEPDSNVLKVQTDATQWILQRSTTTSNNNKSSSSLSDDDTVVRSRGLDIDDDDEEAGSKQGDKDGNIFDWILDIGNIINNNNNGNEEEDKNKKQQ